MQLASRMFPETTKDLNPNGWSSSMRTKWTDTNMWRVGGKQSNADISGRIVFFSHKKEKKLQKKKKNQTSKTQNNIPISNCPIRSNTCSFSWQRRVFLSGVLIQLKINTGNEAAALSKRASSLPLSLYVAGRRQCRLCCQDAAQTLVGFLAETLAGMCIVPLSFLPQPVSAKDENYSRLDRNLEQQLLLDDQLREQRRIVVVVPEPWCARCMQPFVKDIEIIVDGSSVFSSYRRATATQWGSRRKTGRAVAVKNVFVRLPVHSPHKASGQNVQAEQADGRQWR